MTQDFWKINDLELLWTTHCFALCQSGGAEWGDWCEGSWQYCSWAQETQSTRRRDHNILCWPLHVSPLLNACSCTEFHHICLQLKEHLKHYFISHLAHDRTSTHSDWFFTWCRVNLYEDEEEIRNLLKFKPWWRELSSDPSTHSDTCETFTSSDSIYRFVLSVENKVKLPKCIYTFSA